MNNGPVYASRQEESAIINLRVLMLSAIDRGISESALLTCPEIVDKITVINTRWRGNDYHGAWVARIRFWGFDFEFSPASGPDSYGPWTLRHVDGKWPYVG